jgi:DNA-binding CsgD family transcriptional regulator
MPKQNTPSHLLTRRERSILLHLAEDRSNQEIAGLETLALNSVKWYVQQIYARLGVNRPAPACARSFGDYASSSGDYASSSGENARSHRS